MSNPQAKTVTARQPTPTAPPNAAPPSRWKGVSPRAVAHLWPVLAIALFAGLLALQSQSVRAVPGEVADRLSQKLDDLPGRIPTRFVAPTKSDGPRTPVELDKGLKEALEALTKALDDLKAEQTASQKQTKDALTTAIDGSQKETEKRLAALEKTLAELQKKEPLPKEVVESLQDFPGKVTTLNNTTSNGLGRLREEFAGVTAIVDQLRRDAMPTWTLVVGFHSTTGLSFINNRYGAVFTDLTQHQNFRRLSKNYALGLAAVTGDFVLDPPVLPFPDPKDKQALPPWNERPTALYPPRDGSTDKPGAVGARVMSLFRDGPATVQRRCVLLIDAQADSPTREQDAVWGSAAAVDVVLVSQEERLIDAVKAEGWRQFVERRGGAFVCLTAPKAGADGKGLDPFLKAKLLPQVRRLVHPQYVRE